MEGARRLDLVGFVACLAAGLVALWWRWQALPVTLSAEQAESLALARGLVAGFGPRLTEFSATLPAGPSVAWLGVQAAVLAAGLAPELWLPRIALGLLAASLGFAAARGPLGRTRPVRVEDGLPFVAVGFSTPFAEAAARGSGAALWCAALALAAVLTTRAIHLGRAAFAGGLMGLLCLVRLEAVWLLLATVPAWWIGARLEGRRPWGETARFLGSGLAWAGLVFGARFVVFGGVPLDGLLPGDAGFEATTEFLSRQSRWLWAALAGVLIATLWRRFHLRGGGLVAAWVVMTLVIATWVETPRPFFLAVLPVLAVLVGEGLAAAREGAVAAGQEPAIRRLSWLAFGGLGLVVTFAGAASYALEPRLAPAHAPRVSPEFDAEFKVRGLQQPLVVWTDAAEAAALFPRARVVVALAASPLVADQLLSEGPPDLVDPRLALGAAPALAAALTPGPGGALWLKEQSPDDDPRCPEGRLALLSSTPQTLLGLLEQDVGAEALGRALSRWRCALAALDPAHLPDLQQRRALADRLRERARVFGQQGRLELAVRAASLAATLSGEDVHVRGEAERLRARWLGVASQP